MIEGQGLCKRYDDVQAVDGVDLHLQRGRTLGLIGPNGSGKTTLLRMIATLAKPDAGRVRVCGFDAAAAPREVRRRLSFMPAEASAPLDLSVGEYMAYFAAAAGVTRRERPRAVEEALTLTDLDAQQKTSVRSLSTGNRQRLLLAKTLLGDPQLLVLDEPASGLDPRARIEIRAFLRELARLGKTILISSHILADIEHICTDICILEAGRPVLSGTIEDLRRGLTRGVKRLTFRVPDAQRAAALACLRRQPAAEEVEEHDGRLRLICRAPTGNVVLQALLAAEVEILEYREERPDLEAIFMASTRGLVT
jgi:ABC-2 type transport system ATP-binding protein